MHKPRYINLIGRQVYFTMSKGVFIRADIYSLTPGKLYTVIKRVDKSGAYIMDDKNGETLILFKPYS